MAPRLLSPEQLAGLYEKLKRADESIVNLDAEITAFLKDRPHSGFSEDKQKALDEWMDYHIKRGVPPRFAVLAGEIIHHLRSCLDHIAWMLSSDAYKRDHATAISFPIATTKPTTKDELRSYKRQVDGISSADALRVIEESQPCNAPNPLDTPLLIIHELDRIDKHHEIVLVIRRFNMGITIPKSVLGSIIIWGSQQMDKDAFTEYFAQKVEVKISPYIAFAKFGHRENQPIRPSLMQLANAIRDLVERFSNL
jgi:hypothetical protein